MACKELVHQFKQSLIIHFGRMKASALLLLPLLAGMLEAHSSGCRCSGRLHRGRGECAREDRSSLEWYVWQSVNIKLEVSL